MSGSSFFAPAKLNLFLHVVGRRADGYHLLESVFQLLDFGDRIEVSVRRDGAIRRVRELPGVPEEIDLTMRAAHALRKAAGCALGADIAVDKRIAQGGGLGGGSSDAATVLFALNRLWKLDISRRELARIGLALGADVPFFIFGRNAFARGIGEDLVAVDVPRRWFVVLAPACRVATADVFRDPNLTRNTKSVKITDFSDRAWSFPKPFFRNDLESVVCDRFAAVARGLDWLRGFDAEASITARMSGSGACVFAGFGARDKAEAVLSSRPADCGGFVASGLARHPLADLAHD